AITSKLLAGVVGLADQARIQLERMKEGGEVDPLVILNITKAAAYIVGESSRAARTAMELEQLELSVFADDTATSTSATSGLSEEAAASLSLEEVEKRIAAAQAALSRAKANGTFEFDNAPGAVLAE